MSRKLPPKPIAKIGAKKPVIIRPKSQPVDRLKERVPQVELGMTVDLTFHFSSKVPTRKSDLQLKGSRMFEQVESKDYLKLFTHKVTECAKVCDFSSPTKDEKAKLTKSQLLAHLLAGFGNPEVVKALTADAMKEFYEMILANLERRLPLCPIWGPLDVKDQVFDLAWLHLQQVYELVAAATASQHAQAAISSRVLTVLATNGTSLDDRERAAVKQTLIKLYQKFVGMRAKIRAHLGYGFALGRASGELIEVFTHCIGGFNSPLKAEHVKYVKEYIFPLIMHDDFWKWTDEYTTCISKLIDKQPEMLMDLCKYAVMRFPCAERRKQGCIVMFLRELSRIHTNLMTKEHWVYVLQLANNTIYNEHVGICGEGMDFVVDPECVELFVKWSETSIPMIWDALHRGSTKHWDPATRDLAKGTLKKVYTMDPDCFEKFANKDAQKQRKRQRSKAKKEFKNGWMVILEGGKAKDSSIKSINFEGLGH